MLREGLIRRSRGDSSRGMRQSIYPYAPDDEEPAGTLQPLLTLCLPTLGVERLSMRHRRRPGLFPFSVAHRVAQHQHEMDILPTPTHACTLEACFDDQFVGAFDAARANGPAHCLIGRILHVRFTLLQVGHFLLHGWARIASGQPVQVSEDPCWSLVLEPVQHALQPASRQSASCCSYGLPDVVDVFGSMRPRRACAPHPHDGSRPVPAATLLHLAPRTPLPPVPVLADAFRPARPPQSARRQRVARRRRSAACTPPPVYCA